MSAQPWTPVDAEMRLRAIDAALDAAVEAVKRTRDTEVQRYGAYKDVRDAAMLSDQCPKVIRGGCTTAERDAWVSRESAKAEREYEQAKKDREDAIDDMFKLKDQGAIIGKVSDLVRQAYATAGGYR
jgi:hypothetical protein